MRLVGKHFIAVKRLFPIFPARSMIICPSVWFRSNKKQVNRSGEKKKRTRKMIFALNPMTHFKLATTCLFLVSSAAAIQPITDTQSLRTAVSAWCDNSSNANSTYGNINAWAVDIHREFIGTRSSGNRVHRCSSRRQHQPMHPGAC